MQKRKHSPAASTPVAEVQMFKRSVFNVVTNVTVSFVLNFSTVATALNSLTAVTVKDFLNGALRWELPEEQGAKIGKWISFAFGLLSFGLVFVVEQMGSVLQVRHSLSSSL